MTWYIIAGIAALVALGILIYTYVRDRRYMKKRVLEAMSPDLRKEIEEERAASLVRRELFKEALEEATQKDEDK
ncbi:MAG: hypothetical protein ABH871_08380 [Pseudomonadota bacterium]